MLVAINAEKILNTNSDLTRIINNNIGYADGVGATMALKQKGFKNVVKIPGCELWLDIVAHFYKTKTFYIVGASEEVLQNTIGKLRKEYKGIKIVNYRNGFIKTKHEEQLLIADITFFKPDIVFVAMGTPKQELLMEVMQKKHSAIYQGLGGSFDVYTGKLKRAPKLFLKFGVEWLYRLLLEPTRITRQMKLVKFLFLVKLGRL